MNADLILKLNDLIESLNSNQQDIARNLIIDEKNYLIMDTTYNRIRDIYIKNLKNNEVHNFIAFVKSKCNCG